MPDSPAVSGDKKLLWPSPTIHFLSSPSLFCRHYSTEHTNCWYLGALASQVRLFKAIMLKRAHHNYSSVKETECTQKPNTKTHKTGTWNKKRRERVPLTTEVVPPSGSWGILWITWYTQVHESYLKKHASTALSKTWCEHDDIPGKN